MSKKFTKAIAMILCVVSLLAMVGCGGTTEKAETSAPAASGDKAEAPAAAAAESKPVVVAVPDIFNTLNPFATNNVSDQVIFNQVYETLAVLGEDSTAQPCLAKSWEISEDGLVYTIKLVEDAVFHNGEKLTAKDVAFTYEWAKQFPGRQLYYKSVVSTEIVDDYTIVFTLDSPQPLFMTYSQSMPIMNEKFVTEKGEEGVAKEVCGTGPYTITSYDPAVAVKLAAFPDYRLGEAAIKEAEIRYYSDKSTAQIALETGDVDLMSVPTTSALIFEMDDNFNTDRTLPLYTALIAMNTTVEPFDNKLVRQAFAYAIDRQSVIDIAYDGLGTLANFMCYTNCFGVDYSDATQYTYDPAKAKELLAEAGYPDGLNLSDFGVEMKTFAGYHSKIAEIFQQNLADIGVTIEIVNTETPDEDVESGNYSIMNQGITYRADFSYSECHYGSVGIGGNNYAQMNDPWVDEMFAKGVKETDPEARKAIYKELIEYLVDYCPCVYIFHKEEIYAWDKDLNANVKDATMFPYHIYEWSWNA